MDHSSFAWPGTALGRIASATVAAAQARDNSDSRPSTAGLITSISTRLAACSGRLKKSTARISLGPISLFLRATLRSNRWASRPTGLEAVSSDTWQPQESIFWGPEGKWLADERYSGDRDLQNPLAAVQMGLIYVNPEGPNGNPDPLASARDIRETFSRMAMNDEETVALIAGGHSFGKTHGAGDVSLVGPEPEAADITAQGLGWLSKFGTGKGGDAIGSGLEVTWTKTPTKWSNDFFEHLFGFEWQLTKSPAGAHQWTPKNHAGDGLVPAPHNPARHYPPSMLTSDLALRVDPAYEKISRRFAQDQAQFAEAFAKAWYKLTHRDMGPIARYLGPLVPKEALIWQDPIPAVDHPLIAGEEILVLQARILESGLSVSQLVTTAWASASTFRGSDKRGGANGARIRLMPQKDWEVNQPLELAKILQTLAQVQNTFNQSRSDGKKVSLADLIVLGGNAGVEAAARNVGYDLAIPFKAGRTDASQEQTDAHSFTFLEPTVDGFRNYFGSKGMGSPEEALVNRAQLLTLTAPEMTVLIGGLRVMNCTVGGCPQGVFTTRHEALSNDFFVNLLDMRTQWEMSSESADIFYGRDRTTNELKWTATRVDLIFGSNAPLRAIAEVYAADDAKETFVKDFVAAWTKIMELDRFDLA